MTSVVVYVCQGKLGYKLSKGALELERLIELFLMNNFRRFLPKAVG